MRDPRCRVARATERGVGDEHALVDDEVVYSPKKASSVAPMSWRRRSPYMQRESTPIWGAPNGGIHMGS